MPDERLYRAGASVIRMLLRLPIAAPMTHAAKVWMRHARTVTWLRSMRFDAVIDGGANIGEFASLVRLALPDADLVCVEPHAPSAADLRRHGFRVVEAALWHERGTLNLSQPGSESTSCTVVGNNAGRPSWRVQSVRLDDLDIRGDRVLVKLDLQGAEPAALEGMGALWDRCSALLLEVSLGPTGTYETLRAMLAARGFREYATLNELEVGDRVVEADKVWLREASQ